MTSERARVLCSQQAGSHCQLLRKAGLRSQHELRSDLLGGHLDVPPSVFYFLVSSFVLSAMEQLLITAKGGLIWVVGLPQDGPCPPLRIVFVS